MANPWDNDPIALPAGGKMDAPPRAPMPWDNDPIVRKPEDSLGRRAAAFLSGVTSGVAGNLADYGAGAEMAPYMEMAQSITGQKLPTNPMDIAQGSIAARRQMAQENPGSNLLGRVAGGVGTAMAAGPALGFNAAKGFLPWLGAAGSYVGRNSLFGALTGATEGNTAGERLDNAVMGGAIGGGATAIAPIARGVQAIPNIAQSAWTAGRNLFTTRGHEGLAGQMFREAVGGMPWNPVASQVPGVELRTAQATGIPGIVGMERGMEDAIRRTATSPGDIVQGGRTPNQMAALSDALVPGSAGREPADLLRSAGERGSRSVQAADEAITQTESRLWRALDGKKIDANPLAAHVEDALGQLPEYQRAVATQAGNYIARLRSLGANAEITGKESINGVRSDLLAAARRAATPDEANAYKNMAGAMLDYLEKAPEIAGRPAFAGTLMRGSQDARPAVPADPATWSSWQAARDFTRESNQATGQPSIAALLTSNQQGNVTANPARAFGQFFPQGGGAEGVRQLERMGGYGGGGEMGGAMRDYNRASILRSGRAGGQDAAGNPLLNPGAIARNIDERLPALSGTPTFAGAETTALNNIGETAGLLARPQSVGRVTGSNTFEKFKQGDMLAGALGQAGAPLMGGMVGAGIAGTTMPGPGWATMPAGFAAGALAGKAGIAPMLNNRWMNQMATGGAQAGVERALIKALASPNEAERLMATRMLESRHMFQPGILSALIEGAGRSAAPVSMHGGAP